MTTAIILAYVGVALMVGFTGLASAIGTSICGMTAIGAMKKNPGKFGSYMVLSVMPSTQGLYGFAAYFILAGRISPDMSIFAASAIFGVGLIMAVSGVSSAYMQAKVCSNGIAAIGNGHDVMGNTMILGAFPELYAILGFATSFLVNGVLVGLGM
jgi:V/A-type H+-transporting ATPase subunit K